MKKASDKLILQNYENAREIFHELGVDTDECLKIFSGIPLSVHNWQDDDVMGFEKADGVASQNLVTGNYPGRARNGDELRADMDMAFSLSPCKPRVNLHSMYGEPGTTERNEQTAADFSRWIDWAKQNKYAMDFNVSFFTHPKMRDGFSLASPDKATRDYWIQAGINGRKIADTMGRELGEVCINNIWVPDGLKDLPADRFAYRELLMDSLDKIYAEKLDSKNMRDVLEGKVFSIGTEAFTVGSHEFYLGYATKNNIGVCMDTGHYHPTESIIDKISAVYPFVQTLMLHISRGLRWDSDHVVIQNDDVDGIMRQIVRAGLYKEDKLFMGLDYFDASINRVAAWVIGSRAAGKSLLSALLEPYAQIKDAEEKEDYTLRLAWTDEAKNLPVNAVWDYLCLTSGKPVGMEWMDTLKRYESQVMLARD